MRPNVEASRRHRRRIFMASSTDADADVDAADVENCPELRRARKRSQKLRKIAPERDSGTIGKVGITFFALGLFDNFAYEESY